MQTFDYTKVVVGQKRILQSMPVSVIKASQTLHDTLPTLQGNKIVCVEVLRPSQPNGVMSSAVSLPNHTFTGQA